MCRSSPEAPVRRVEEPRSRSRSRTVLGFVVWGALGGVEGFTVWTNLVERSCGLSLRIETQNPRGRIGLRVESYSRVWNPPPRSFAKSMRIPLAIHVGVLLCPFETYLLSSYQLRRSLPFLNPKP